jgi:hypothetical protein
MAESFLPKNYGDIRKFDDIGTFDDILQSVNMIQYDQNKIYLNFQLKLIFFYKSYLEFMTPN